MASTGPAKGQAISLGSLFSPEDTAKAARRVEEAATERRRDLQQLLRFSADNSALTSLVRRLPDDVSHDIMVPFGGVAFFPGRLIHTNEFLVLLGEGYYAERSSKQTTEILKRRGENIESQIKSLKASIADLEAEAQYFSSTASEAAEGLIEIREEYIDDAQENTTVASSSKGDNKEREERGRDSEYDRVMAKLDKLEKEELEAGSDYSDNESDEGSDEEDFHEESGAHGASIDLSKPLKEIEDSVSINLASAERYTPKKPLSTAKAVSFKIPDEQSGNIQHEPPLLAQEPQNSTSRPKDNVEESKKSHKTMIGSVVERDHNLTPILPPRNTSSNQASSSNPSRPVSRFKLQKGGH